MINEKQQKYMQNKIQKINVFIVLKTQFISIVNTGFWQI